MFSQSSIFFQSIWPAALTALSVILVIIEYKLKKRAVFTLVSALFCAATAIVLLLLGGGLSELLLLICATLAVRLFFEILEGRKNK